MSAGSAIGLNAPLVPIKGNPAFSVYSATKAALRSFVAQLGVDLKGRDIRVNAVSPGVIPTPAITPALGLRNGNRTTTSSPSLRPFRWAEREPQMRSSRRSRSSPPTKAVTSLAVNSSWTAVWARSKERPVEGEIAVAARGTRGTPWK
jgi:NAD(P)-dependent dehydrogenase (short-subunit alcohol dehydrogenase family)